MDISMPKLSGIGAMRRLKASHAESKVIFLTLRNIFSTPVRARCEIPSFRSLEVERREVPRPRKVSGLRGSKPTNHLFQIGDGARFLAFTEILSIHPASWRHFGYGSLVTITWCYRFARGSRITIAARIFQEGPTSG
jgi:hypothetical protein